MAPISRKRLRTAVVGIFCATVSQTATGFVSTSIPTPMRSLSIPQQHQLKATAKPVFENLPRLTPQEQTDLLQQAVTARLIKQKETELVLQTPNLKIRQSQLSATFDCDVQELEEAVYQGQLARETLVTRNMGLVHYTANSIFGKSRSKFRSLSREDLVQEGAIGLARAIDRWDPEIGGRFSTYAVYWIRAAMLRCIAERDDLVRVPEHVSAALRKVTKAARTLGIDIDGEGLVSSFSSSTSTKMWKEAEAAKALAIEAGLSDKQLSELLKVRKRRSSGILSFETWMQNGQDYQTDLTSVQENEGAIDTANVDKELLKTTLARFLRPREMEALSWRYGLNNEPAPVARDYVAEAEERIYGSQNKLPSKGRWGEAMSFVEVGKHMQVSAEYGRRLCHAALKKLQNAAEEGALEPSLLSA